VYRGGGVGVGSAPAPLDLVGGRAVLFFNAIV
jgi:hypothetical protein